MNELLSDTPQTGNRPLSPDTRQLVEEFIARMEAIQAEQTQALLIAATEAAGKKAEEAQPRQRRLRAVFSPVFGWLSPSLSRRSRRPQPPAPAEDNTAVIIDASYQVIDGKE